MQLELAQAVFNCRLVLKQAVALDPGGHLMEHIQRTLLGR
jgi:hypothetical protein